MKFTVPIEQLIKVLKQEVENEGKEERRKGRNPNFDLRNYD